MKNQLKIEKNIIRRWLQTRLEYHKEVHDEGEFRIFRRYLAEDAIHETDLPKNSELNELIIAEGVNRITIEKLWNQIEEAQSSKIMAYEANEDQMAQEIHLLMSQIEIMVEFIMQSYDCPMQYGINCENSKECNSSKCWIEYFLQKALEKDIQDEAGQK